MGEKQAAIWMRNCASDCTSDVNMLAESEPTDANVEHVVKPDNEHSSNASHSYRFMRLKSENEKLQNSLMCRRCHSTQVQTLTLPCCHIVCCEACADAIDDCPLCMTRILGTVKIFLA